MKRWLLIAFWTVASFCVRGTTLALGLAIGLTAIFGVNSDPIPPEASAWEVVLADPVTAVGVITAAAATAVASSAAVISAVGVLGAYLIGAAIMLAGTLLTMLLTPSRDVRQQSGTRLQEYNPHPAVRFRFGEFRTQGQVVFRHVRGEVLYLSVLLNAAPSHSISRVWINESVELKFDAADWVNARNFSSNVGAQFSFPWTVDGVSPLLRIWIGLGEQTQFPQPWLTRLSGKFPQLSTASWHGCTILHAYCIFGPQSSLMQRWWLGEPRFEVLGKWTKLYDPRLDPSSGVGDPAGTHDAHDPDTWEWSPNPSLVSLFLLRHRRVLNRRDEQILIDMFAEAADDCEGPGGVDEGEGEFVPTLTVGTTLSETQMAGNWAGEDDQWQETEYYPGIDPDNGLIFSLVHAVGDWSNYYTDTARFGVVDMTTGTYQQTIDPGAVTGFMGPVYVDRYTGDPWLLLSKDVEEGFRLLRAVRSNSYQFQAATFETQVDPHDTGAADIGLGPNEPVIVGFTEDHVIVYHEVKAALNYKLETRDKTTLDRVAQTYIMADEATRSTDDLCGDVVAFCMGPDGYVYVATHIAEWFTYRVSPTFSNGVSAKLLRYHAATGTYTDITPWAVGTGPYAEIGSTATNVGIKAIFYCRQTARIVVIFFNKRADNLPGTTFVSLDNAGAGNWFMGAYTPETATWEYLGRMPDTGLRTADGLSTDDPEEAAYFVASVALIDPYKKLDELPFPTATRDAQNMLRTVEAVFTVTGGEISVFSDASSAGVRLTVRDPDQDYAVVSSSSDIDGDFDDILANMTPTAPDQYLADEVLRGVTEFFKMEDTSYANVTYLPTGRYLYKGTSDTIDYIKNTGSVEESETWNFYANNAWGFLTASEADVAFEPDWRFRCDGTVEINTRDYGLLDGVLDSMAGHLDTSGGRIGVRAGVWKEPTGDPLSVPVGDGFEIVDRTDPGFDQTAGVFIGREQHYTETETGWYILSEPGIDFTPETFDPDRHLAAGWSVARGPDDPLAIGTFASWHEEDAEGEASGVMTFASGTPASEQVAETYATHAALHADLDGVYLASTFDPDTHNTAWIIRAFNTGSGSTPYAIWSIYTLSYSGPTPAPYPVQNATPTTAAYGDRGQELQFSMVREMNQARHLVQISSERLRKNRTITGVWPSDEWTRRVGERVTIDYDWYPDANGTWVIVSEKPIAVEAEDGFVIQKEITLKEDSEAIYGWDPDSWSEAPIFEPIDAEGPIQSAPSNLQALSDESTARQLISGVSTLSSLIPRIRIWFEAAEFAPNHYEVQVDDGTGYVKRAEIPGAISTATGSPPVHEAYIEPVTMGASYDIRVRAVSWGVSEWVEVTDVLVQMFTLTVTAPIFVSESYDEPSETRTLVLQTPNDASVHQLLVYVSDTEEGPRSLLTSAYLGGNLPLTVIDTQAFTGFTRWYHAYVVDTWGQDGPEATAGYTASGSPSRAYSTAYSRGYA